MVELQRTLEKVVTAKRDHACKEQLALFKVLLHLPLQVHVDEAKES